MRIHVIIANLGSDAGQTWMVPSSESTALWSPAHVVPIVVFAPRFTEPRGMPVVVLKDDIMRSTNSRALRINAPCHALLCMQIPLVYHCWACT
jgi:hypothetical protein